MNDIQPAAAWTEEEWDPMYCFIVFTLFLVLLLEKEEVKYKIR